ncbi:NAD-dependent epimerase/dehydratase family protein [Roseivirga thermotolerans]|uniref:NAD-dependent epimerase/dehydratase family protein n=1 Tax=Roseivirga thermotolerans TaxID=1758176 RepID=UPI00273E0B0B|nr:NAD-dependent epimerase/dehydratase family protein [Roseivirga thermotolerans]
MNKTILVTGSSGFVGKRFIERGSREYLLKTISLQNTEIDDIDFSNVEVVLHLAGIAHRMEKTQDQLYYDVNYELTKSLAIQAKNAGVKQFVFMSTIKVYGDHYHHLTLETPCLPNDAYGKSKLLAEEFLNELNSEIFKVAIIRPPLIYGPGVKGNIAKLIRLVETKTYIPLGGIDNQRSMVSIDNLIQLILLIIEKESSGVFLIQDAKPISTSQLLGEIINAKKSKANLIRIPKVVEWMIRLLKPEVHIRIFGSLVVDDSQTKKLLNYKPLETTSEGVLKMIKSN